MIYEKTNSEQESGEKVVDTILKQLTPENIQKQIQEIKAIELPQDIQKWVEEYEKVGDRNDFIWKWLYKMNGISSFLGVIEKNSSSLRKVKTLLNMFVVSLDDISEENKENLLKELLKIPFNKHISSIDNLSSEDQNYLKFTIALWKEIQDTIKDYPKYSEYKEIFNFDIQQFLSEVIYTHLIYKYPFLMNESEYWNHVSQGMQIILDFDLDLMCSVKEININELGVSRELVLILQRMGRIGNWLSTWEREVKKMDFTAIFFPYLITEKKLTIKDLLTKKPEEIVRVVKESGAEEYLIQKWEQYYKKTEKYKDRIYTIDLNKVLASFRQLFFMHLSSRGYK